jgi:hypothetical protein
MRAYPTDRLNFLETVQVYFLEVTGKGVVLGSRDAELLQAWRAEGATAAAVCQGIDDAVRARAELPRSIAGCRKWIEPRVEASRALATGGNFDEPVIESDGDRQPDDSWATEVLGRIETAGRQTQRDSFRDAYRSAYRQIKMGMESGEDVTRLVLQADETLVQTFWQALSENERTSIDADVAASPQLQSMGARAKELFIEARRRRALEQEYGLVELFT